MNIEPQPRRSSRPAIELDPSQQPDREYDLVTVFIVQETRARRRTILFNTLAGLALSVFIIAFIIAFLIIPACAAHFTDIQFLQSPLFYAIVFDGFIGLVAVVVAIIFGYRDIKRNCTQNKLTTRKVRACWKELHEDHPDRRRCLWHPHNAVYCLPCAAPPAEETDRSQGEDMSPQDMDIMLALFVLVMCHILTSYVFVKIDLWNIEKKQNEILAMLRADGEDEGNDTNGGTKCKNTTTEKKDARSATRSLF